MLHDCRQLVSWDVWLSPETGVTLIFKEDSLSNSIINYYAVKRFKNTVNDKLKEGENEVKSMWP